MIQLVKNTFWAGQKTNPLDLWERTSQRPDCGPGTSIGMLGKSLLGSAFGFAVCRCQSLSSPWRAASLVRSFCKKGPIGKASGFAWTLLDVVRLRTSSSYRNDPEKYVTHSELFLLPQQEGAGGPRAGSAVRALRLCGNAQGVCADWFAPFDGRKRSCIKW